MKAHFFYFFLLFFTFSCNKESTDTNSKFVSISDRIQYQEDVKYLILKSGKFKYQISKEKLPLKKIMLLNSSLTGYILELEKENLITGISSPEYIYSPKIHQLVKEGTIQNVGNETKYDVEKILQLKPDAVFTNYIQSFENTYELLKQNGVEVIFIDEYLESEPLKKSAVIKAFGLLLGAERKADEIYSNVEKNYLQLKTSAEKAKNQPVVLTNEMYGNQWFLPGGKTFTANYFKDANANYLLKDNQEDRSIPLSFEEVFIKAKDAQYWVNLSDYSNRKQLLQINPNYAKMKVYQSGKLYSLHGRTNGTGNDAFERGAVRADLVLKDYIKIFHPELFSGEPFTYIKEIP